jgi:hypothetical protein
MKSREAASEFSRGLRAELVTPGIDARLTNAPRQRRWNDSGAAVAAQIAFDRTVRG